MGRPAPDPDNVPVQVGTTMPYAAHLECLQRRAMEPQFEWKQMIMSGYQLAKMSGDMAKRIQQLEHQVKAYEEKTMILESQIKRVKNSPHVPLGFFKNN